MDTAKSIVNALLDDIDADLPSHKSEVRILPTNDPHRFDVTLLTGFDPLYIGSISHKGNVWRPVEVMKGIPRAFRSRLHFVGPQKEDVAMAMVQTLKPIWKRLIAPSLMAQLESTKAEDIEKEAAQAEKPESPEQAEAGNYRKGHITLHGFEIAIENAKGSTRSGTNKNGTPWKVTMPAHYGYIKGTKGKDKDHLDVYIGTKPDGIMAYVVNQRTFEGAFDEHKIMLGYHGKDEAIADYDAAFSGNLGPRLRASVMSTTVDKLKEWIASGDTKKPFDGIVESLLEAEEEFGYERLKALAMRVDQIPEGTEFHIGFAIHTSGQFEIEARANDDAIQVDWDAVNKAIIQIEINAQNILNEVGVRCRGEGHSGDDELIGSAWVTSGTGGFYIIKDYVERDEPYSTSSGTAENIRPGFGVEVYRGVPEQIAALIDVDISFFSIDKEQMGLGESDEIDPKQMAMRLDIRTPRTYGELRKGDVFYDETGAFNRVEGYTNGSNGSYQDADGKMVYSGVPSPMVVTTQFSPAYAYGRYTHKEQHHIKSGFLGAELVDVPDSSDEALWNLVDADIIKDGRSTAEQLQQEKDRHQAWLARPEQQAQAQARAAMLNQLEEPPEE